MTLIVTTNSNTVGDNITLAGGEDLFFAPNVVRTSSTGAGIVATLQGHAMNVLGTVYGETFGIQIGDAGAGTAFSTLTLGPDAMIVSHGRGISSLGSTLTSSCIRICMIAGPSHCFGSRVIRRGSAMSSTGRICQAPIRSTTVPWRSSSMS